MKTKKARFLRPGDIVKLLDGEHKVTQRTINYTQFVTLWFEDREEIKSIAWDEEFKVLN